MPHFRRAFFATGALVLSAVLSACEGNSPTEPTAASTETTAGLVVSGVVGTCTPSANHPCPTTTTCVASPNHPCPTSKTCVASPNHPCPTTTTCVASPNHPCPTTSNCVASPNHPCPTTTTCVASPNHPCATTTCTARPNHPCPTTSGHRSASLNTAGSVSYAYSRRGASLRTADRSSRNPASFLRDRSSVEFRA